MTAFWYQVCPKCDGQGRLTIKKNLAYGNLFLCCDECSSCWNGVDDLQHQRNAFSEFNIRQRTRYASDLEIQESGWGIVAKRYIK